MAVVKEHSDLLQWIRRQGGTVHMGLDMMRALPSGGRGVFATESLAAQTKLVVVPPAASLSSETEAASTHAAAWLRQQHSDLGPFLTTVLLLLAELAAGDKSPLAPWLRCLPTAHDCLLAWSPEERAALQGTEIEGADANYTEIFQQTVLPIISQQQEWWPARSLATFHFAAGMVQSRSFHLNKVNWMTGERKEEEQLYMLAGIDMVNHSSHDVRRNATLEFTPAAPAAAAAAAAGAVQHGSFALTTERDVAAGEEVCIQYGENDLSDSQLLQIYGFVEGASSSGKAATGENTHNFVGISPELVFSAYQDQLALDHAEAQAAGEPPDLQADVDFEAAREWLRQRRLPPFRLSAAMPLPADLLTTVMVLLMDEEEFEEYKSDAAGTEALPTILDANALQGAVEADPDFVSDLCGVLLATLQARNTAYAGNKHATSVGSSGAAAVSYRTQCAHKVVRGELVILKAAIQQVLQLLSSVKDEDEGSDAEGDSGGEGSGGSEGAAPGSKRACR